MTVQWTYDEAVAREMAPGGLLATIVVRDPLHPVDVAGDIHARLVRLGLKSLCLHASDDLDIVSQVAVTTPFNVSWKGPSLLTSL